MSLLKKGVGSGVDGVPYKILYTVSDFWASVMGVKGKEIRCKRIYTGVISDYLTGLKWASIRVPEHIRIIVV